MTKDEIAQLVDAEVARALRGRLVNETEYRKQIARSIATVAVSRGQLKRQPCAVCGAPDAEKHHPDYSQPKLVQWLCKAHHRAEHARLRGPLIPRLCTCGRPTKGRRCVACRVRKSRGAIVSGSACKVCGIADARMLRWTQFTDERVILCANHAALVGRRRLCWLDFAAQLGVTA